MFRPLRFLLKGRDLLGFAADCVVGNLKQYRDTHGEPPGMVVARIRAEKYAGHKPRGSIILVHQDAVVSAMEPRIYRSPGKRLALGPFACPAAFQGRLPT